MSKKMSNITSKISIIFLIMVVFVVVLTVVVTLFNGRKVSQDSIAEKLTNSYSIQQELISQKATQLELISLLVASDPAFVAYIAEAINTLEEGDSVQDLASISDLLQERQQQFDFDIAIVTTSSGKQIARADQPMTAIVDLSEKKLLKNSLETLTTYSGFWQEQDKLYQAAIVPLSRGSNLIGFLITGNEISNNLLNEMARLAGTHVVAILQKQSAYEIIASSLDLNGSKNLLNKLNNNAIDFSQKTQKLTINRLNLESNTQYISQLNSKDKIYFMNAVSTDTILKPFERTRLMLLLIGLLTFVLSIISLFLFIKPMFSPLKKLSENLTEISTGNLDVEMPEVNNHELQQLSNSIQLLQFNIKGKEQLANHIVDISKRKPLILKSTDEDTMKTGQVIGKRYKILKKLGVGGMGVVFQAIDYELHEIVALKVLKNKQANTKDLDKFKDEIRLARRILDENIIRIHDFGQLGEHVFISMEYVQGYTLQQVLKYSNKLRKYAAKYVSMQMCLGLHAAHNAGIVHRDLKPENFIIDLDFKVKLMDFGIASVENIVTNKQRNKVVEGTVQYFSPEQSQGKGGDERSDIYSLGIIIMELFVGHRPFEDDDEEALMIKNSTQLPALISDYWADAPVRLQNIILRCLEKKPAQRFQSAKAVYDSLQKVMFH